MLSASLHGYPDPATSPDPAVRQLVSALATLEMAPDPSPEFRTELRTQLVAVTPRLVAEGWTEAEPRPAAVVAAPRAHRRRSGGWRRPVAFAVSGVAVLVLLLGGFVWLSRSALPGDTLYGVKRTAESVQLALTSGTEAKARLELHFAKLRTVEVTKLISRPSASAAGPQADASISATTGALVRSTLASADADVLAASQLLTAQAMRSHDTAPLKILSDWVQGQRQRLIGIAHRLPPGPLRARALQSANVVKTVQQQTVQAWHQVRCNCRTCATCGGSTGGVGSSGVTASRSSTGAPNPSDSSSGTGPGAYPSPAPYQPGQQTSSAPYQPGQQTSPAPYQPGGPPTEGGGSTGSSNTESSIPTSVPPSSEPSSSEPPSLPSSDPSSDPSLLPSSSLPSLSTSLPTLSPSVLPLPLPPNHSHPHPSKPPHPSHPATK
jgi:hypothetical protein